MSNYYRSLIQYGATYDADAQAFLTATGIPNDGTIFFAGTPREITGERYWTYVNNLVLDFKFYGLWSKMKAIYPIIGGTAFAHKFNLKDPRDLDEAFRLTYLGGLTHSSTGIVTVGTTGYMNTHFIPANHLTVNDGCWSFYSRTNINENKYDLGTTGNSPTAFNALIMRFGNGSFYGAFDNNYANSTAVANSLGMGIVTRHSANRIKAFKNSTKIIDNSNIGYLSNYPFFILAENNVGVAGNLSNKECAFAHFSSGLDETECANLYTIVQTFQTALGRNV